MKFALCCLLLGTLASPVWAQCCDHCGCQSACQQVCRVVPEIKKVPKAVYDYECEDFCFPGKSERCIEFDECGHKRHVYKPGCGTVYTRKKLIKREIEEEKVTYKWVVETLCCACTQRCAGSDDHVAVPSLANSASQTTSASHASYLAPGQGEAAGRPATDSAPSKGATRGFLSLILRKP